MAESSWSESELLSTFVSITSASEPVAKQLLAAADGNLETAVTLFFDSGAEAQQPVVCEFRAAQASFEEPRADSMSTLRSSGLPPWYEVVWGTAEPARSWEIQPLAFLQEPQMPFSGVGLLQPANGPCGVLAVINAVLIAQCRLKPGWGPQYQAGDADLAMALVAIFQTVAASNTGAVTLFSWGASQGRERLDVVSRVHPVGPDTEKAVAELLPAFKAPGGLLLIVYSCVATRGVDNVYADARRSGGEPPLIVPPHALCTSELLALMMRGHADGNVSAYSPIGGAKTSWHEGSRYTLPIGMLSSLEYPEYEAAEGGTSLPLADELKTPPLAVWIIHSSTHFTLVFHADEDADKQVLSPSPGKFELVHWNGLSPGGPKATIFKVHAVNGSAPPAADVLAEKPHYKPVVDHPSGSEIDSVIQAHRQDKLDRPGQWETWRYEVVLALPEDAVDGQSRPDWMPLPMLYKLPPEGPDPTKPWRCASCYRTRYQTMIFGENEAGSVICKTCGLAPAVAGFSIWLHFDDLPDGQKAVLSRRHAPKMVSILHTKWPRAVVSFDPIAGIPSV